jgi:hypothetical protein
MQKEKYIKKNNTMTKEEKFAKKQWKILLNWIKDDIEFGYNSEMILSKIETNCYDIIHTKAMKHLQKIKRIK